jgi:hypothetical protein
VSRSHVTPSIAHQAIYHIRADDTFVRRVGRSPSSCLPTRRAERFRRHRNRATVELGRGRRSQCLFRRLHRVRQRHALLHHERNVNNSVRCHSTGRSRDRGVGPRSLCSRLGAPSDLFGPSAERPKRSTYHEILITTPDVPCSWWLLVEAGISKKRSDGGKLRKVARDGRTC